MEKSHRTNVLVTSCLKTPVDPNTKTPLALYEREKALPYATGQMDNRDYEKEMEYDSESEYDDEEGPGGRGTPPMIPEYRVDLRELYFSNEEYYRKLEELKHAHLQTMAELEEMYREKLEVTDNEGGNAPGAHRLQWKKNRLMPTRQLRKAYSTQDLNPPEGSFMLDNYADGEVEKGLLTSPKEHIKNMWQDFTVGELTPRHRYPSCSSLRARGAAGLKGKTKSKTKCPEGAEEEPEGWRPKITVPKPFQMMLREAEKKRRKVKSRSEVELENALLRKQLDELTECQKKFRASPVPAHVFLPLYEEIAEHGQERRRLFREHHARLLRSSQKPFSFLERERRRKEQREAQLREKAPKEEKRVFRAKPVPRFVYDSTASEQLKEDQLYRAIKMQMRARELLHSATMPRSMVARRLSEKRRGAADGLERAVETEADFRPKINREVPDFDASYQRFRKHLQNKRDPRPMTVCEPFQLRTSRITSHRERILADVRAEQMSPRVIRWPYVAPTRTASSSLCSSLSGSQELLPTKSTDAAKKRQEAVRKVLEQRKKAEEEEEKWREKQKLRERTLQKLVTKRAQANDPHVALSQSCKTKIKQFRKQDLQRRKEYKEEMREIQERVKERPLLLEQVAQKNARRAAEKRYTETLHGCGLTAAFVTSRAPGPHRRGRPSTACFSSLGRRSLKEESGTESPAGTESFLDDYQDDYEDFEEQEFEEDEGQKDMGDEDAERATNQRDQGGEEDDRDLDQSDQGGEEDDRDLDQFDQGGEENDRNLDQSDQGGEEDDRDLDEDDRDLDQFDQGGEENDRDLDQFDQGGEENDRDLDQSDQGGEEDDRDLDEDDRDLDQSDQDERDQQRANKSRLSSSSREEVEGMEDKVSV